MNFGLRTALQCLRPSTRRLPVFHDATLYPCQAATIVHRHTLRRHCALYGGIYLRVILPAAALRAPSSGLPARASSAKLPARGLLGSPAVGSRGGSSPRARPPRRPWAHNLGATLPGAPGGRSGAADVRSERISFHVCPPEAGAASSDIRRGMAHPVPMSSQARWHSRSPTPERARGVAERPCPYNRTTLRGRSTRGPLGNKQSARSCRSYRRRIPRGNWAPPSYGSSLPLSRPTPSAGIHPAHRASADTCRRLARECRGAPRHGTPTQLRHAQRYANVETIRCATSAHSAPVAAAWTPRQRRRFV